MDESTKNLEELVTTRITHLDAGLQGIVTGIVAGLAMFVATNWLLLKGGEIGPDGREIIGPHLALLSHFFIGYRVTFFGSVIGLAYGFAVGFVVGYLVSRIYNWAAARRS